MVANNGKNRIRLLLLDGLRKKKKTDVRFNFEFGKTLAGMWVRLLVRATI